MKWKTAILIGLAMILFDVVGGAILGWSAINYFEDRHHARKAQFAYHNREYDQAIEDYNRSLQINPKNTHTLDYMGIAYNHKKMISRRK